jgi:hypothetical protein
MTLSKNMYSILDPDRFEPSAKWVLNDNMSLGGRGYTPSKQNPTPQELKNGIYKPRLTLTNRINHTGRREATLRVELSLPKLLFGNNFDELQDSDFPTIIEALRQKLKEMGVIVFTHLLTNAPVSAVHYSKNIPLTDGTTPNYYINKIKEANVKLSLDVNQTDYRNDGHSFKWHCNSYEVAFYDKIKDLEMSRKSDKRSIESDGVMQLDIFDTLKERKMFEVLRMEVRLNKRQKIGQLFRMLGIEGNITFKSVFNKQVAQKVLVYYLNELDRLRPKLIDYQAPSQRALLADLIINNPSFGPRRILQVFGIKEALDTIKPRELRIMFNKYSNRSWYRLIADTNNIRLPKTQDAFIAIRSQLNAFEPLKLVDFQQQMLNNDKYN